MYKIYDKWPEIARESFESNLESVDFKNINDIIFAGMGGSGAIGDIFASILSIGIFSVVDAKMRAQEFTKGLEGSNKLRRKLNSVKSWEEIEKLMKEV